MGLTQLARLEQDRESRRAAVARYRERLSGIRAIDIPFLQYQGDTAHHLFTVLILSDVPRDHIRTVLHERGIQTGFHYPPIHMLTWFRKHRADAKAKLRNTEKAAQRLLSLPLFSGMSINEVDQVCDALLDLLET